MRGVGFRGEYLLRAGRRFGSRSGLLARAFAPGFRAMLDRVDQGLKTGAIHAQLPDGTRRVLGGRAPGFECDVRVHDWRALVRLATGGSAGWYQAWEEGEWSSPDPVPLFALFMANGESLGETGRAKGPWRLAARALHWVNRNTKAGSRRNIEAHYDLGSDFYAAWLDPAMVYSSALFPALPAKPQQLAEAQEAKLEAMLDRAAVPPGGALLDIGCGFGALAARAAARGCKVTGISLSDDQLAWSRSLPVPESGSMAFRKQDYRDVDECYDGIVSIEMVEALGREYWPAFMDCLARNLKSRGRAAVQFISIREELFDGYAKNADFIQAYVFPGGLLIRTSEFRRLAEERGLAWTDQRDSGQHYAETLRLWRANFDRAAAEGRLPAQFDARFRNLWRYYLMYCEGGFRGGGIEVSQVTLVKARG
jgi:cyclopropane-fatty-acyl-phospholipid synthase